MTFNGNFSHFHYENLVSIGLQFIEKFGWLRGYLISCIRTDWSFHKRSYHMSSKGSISQNLSLEMF